MKGNEIDHPPTCRPREYALVLLLQVDPVTDNSYLVKFYLDELSEVVSAADSVLLVRRRCNPYSSCTRERKAHVFFFDSTISWGHQLACSPSPVQ